MRTKLKNLLLNRVSLNTIYNYFISKATGDEHHIFIACLPKSGSTFIADVLVGITGYKFIQFQPIRGTNDHNIDPGVFYENLNKDTITQLHCKPNDSNKLYLKKHKIKVVFLKRDIRSSLKSFYNHILNENDQWFMFSVPKEFKNWKIEKQFDFLIDLVVPWYVNFLTSWANEVFKKDIEIFEIEYDDFKNDNFKVIKDILTFYNITESYDKIQSGIDKSYRKKETLRFNSSDNKVKYEYTSNQVKKIQSLVSYYPELQIKI